MMSAHRRLKPSRDAELLAAIDIGASKAVCLIAQLAPGPDDRLAPEVIGVGLHGILPGDRAAALSVNRENALRSAIDAAERMAGLRIKSAVAAVNGRRLHCRRVAAEIDLCDGRVAQEDVDDCVRAGADAAIVPGYAALHAAPIRLCVDGEEAGSRPVGLAGSKLAAEVIGVSARDSALANVDNLIERCGLRIERCLPAPLAAAKAVLIEDEMDLGAVVLDIGAATTGYCLFERGALVDCGGVALGGDHITRDLAQIFSAPLAHAERVKTLYGSALAGVGDEHKLVDFPQLGGGDVLRVSRAEVSSVITPRLEEIFELCARRLPAGVHARLGVRRAVLTGGGSLLVGARETAERILGVKTRLGRPLPLAGAPDAASAPQFAVCAGLLELAAALRAERRRPLRREQQARAGAGLAASVGAWLKENF